jgi:hypothetical protein
VVAGSEIKMKQENVDYLETVACIARANMVYQQQTPTSLRNEMERGMSLLMSAFLEMYDHWCDTGPAMEPPPERIYFAAKTCVQMRNRLYEVARKEWDGEEEGLFQIMTAYMFLFKHMYVPQN